MRLSTICNTHTAASPVEQAAKALYGSAERTEAVARMRGNIVHAAHAMRAYNQHSDTTPRLRHASLTHAAVIIHPNTL